MRIAKDKFPQHPMKTKLLPWIRILDIVASWLDKILKLIAENRFKSTIESLEALKKESTFEGLSSKYSQLSKSYIILEKKDNYLKIRIPHSGIQGELLGKNLCFGLFTLLASLMPEFVMFGFYVTLLDNIELLDNVDLLNNTALLDYVDLLVDNRMWFFPLAVVFFFIHPLMMTLPLIGIFLFGIFGYTELEFDGQNFKICKSLFEFGRQVRGKVSDIQIIKQEFTNDVRGENIVQCAFIEEKRQIYFGRTITTQEQKYLIIEITKFLETQGFMFSN